MKDRESGIRYYVTAKVPCRECWGTGRISPPGQPARRHETQIGIMCLICDGTGTLRVDAPFEDALNSALEERAVPPKQQHRPDSEHG